MRLVAPAAPWEAVTGRTTTVRKVAPEGINEHYCRADFVPLQTDGAKRGIGALAVQHSKFKSAQFLFKKARSLFQVRVAVVVFVTSRLDFWLSICRFLRLHGCSWIRCMAGGHR